MNLAGVAFRDQHRVAAAEGEGVGHHGVEIQSRAALIRHVVEIALGIGMVHIDGGGNGIVLECQHGGHEFHRAGRAMAQTLPRTNPRPH